MLYPDNVSHFKDSFKECMIIKPIDLNKHERHKRHPLLRKDTPSITLVTHHPGPNWYYT